MFRHVACGLVSSAVTCPLPRSHGMWGSVRRPSAFESFTSAIFSSVARRIHLAGGAKKMRQQLSHVLLDAWPDGWSQRYFSNGYLYRDPAIRLVSSGAPPFRWSDIPRLCKMHGSGRLVIKEAAEIVLRRGLTSHSPRESGRPSDSRSPVRSSTCAPVSSCVCSSPPPSRWARQSLC